MTDPWNQIRDCFDTDDGSLPEISLGRLSGEQVVSIYGFLRSLGGTLRDTPTLWHKGRQLDVPIDSLPNPAALVVSDEAECFHFILQAIPFQGETLPDLGVFVFTDMTSLDYRMGPEWRLGSVRAFYRLLDAMLALAPGSHLVFDRTFKDPLAFLDAWTHFAESPPPSARGWEGEKLS